MESQFKECPFCGNKIFTFGPVQKAPAFFYRCLGGCGTFEVPPDPEGNEVMERILKMDDEDKNKLSKIIKKNYEANKPLFIKNIWLDGFLD